MAGEQKPIGADSVKVIGPEGFPGMDGYRGMFDSVDDLLGEAPNWTRGTAQDGDPPQGPPSKPEDTSQSESSHVPQQESPTDPAPSKPQEQPQAPKWDSPENPYYGIAQQQQAQLEHVQRQAILDVFRQADEQLKAQGFNDQQRQQILLAEAERLEALAIAESARRTEAQLQARAKPLYVDKLIGEYREKGVTLDRNELLAMETPQEMQAYARGMAKAARSSAYDQRARDGVDNVGSAPVASGSGSSQPRFGSALAAALYEADRRGR